MKKIVLPFMLSFILLILFVPSIYAESTPESKNLIPIMTSDSSPSGRVTYSNAYLTQLGFRAFNGIVSYGDTASWGTSNTTGWLGYEFDNAAVVNKYIILFNKNQNASWSLASQLPASWTFEGSNNNSDWTILDTQKDYTDWKHNENTFVFENDKFYKFYRINITKNNGATAFSVNLTIHEMQFWGYSSTTNPTKWEYKKALSENKSGVALVALKDRIYAIGGLSSGGTIKTVEEYDPQSDTWTKKSDLNIARFRASAAVIDGKIYVTGGASGDISMNSVEIYDPSTDKWSIGTSLPKPVAGHTSVNLNGKLLVIGGHNSSNNASTDVFEYNPSNDTWSNKASLNIGRRYTASAVINGKVYVLGGINGSENILNTLEVYDSSIDKWVFKKEMPTKRWGLSVSNSKNELFAIGGFVGVASLSGESTPRTEKYDPITDSWLTVSSMNTSRGSVAAVTLNNAIYAAGGSHNSTQYNVFEKYSLGEDQEFPEPGEPTNPTDPQPTGDRAILVVTLNTGLEKEFDLSMDEVHSFITWYENKQAGKGNASYALNKHNNKGPFTSRKDYVIFDKILTFEVSEYTAK